MPSSPAPSPLPASVSPSPAHPSLARRPQRPQRPQRTLGAHLVAVTGRNLLTALVLAVAYAAVVIVVESTGGPVGTGVPQRSGAEAQQAQVEAARADADRQARRLVQRHGCWNSERPQPADMVGRLPGHVVLTVQRPDGSLRTRYSAQEADLHRALEAVLGPGEARGLVVHGFCR